jgi:phosphoglucosamine mutase
VNVRLKRAFDLEADPAVQAVVRDVEAELGDRGRVVVRTSGTEPVVRVMVEAPSEAEAATAAARVRSALEQA